MPENYSDNMFRHCVNEVIRLGSQDFFKADDLLVADLAKALAHCADTEEHATRMISTWKASTRAMLHESDLVELADSTEIRGELPSGCGRCFGTDFVIIEKNGYTAAKRCSCARGRELAKMDKPVTPTPRTFDFASYFNQATPSAPAEPEPESIRKRTTRPPQTITAEEVDRLRAAELERRKDRKDLQ